MYQSQYLQSPSSLYIDVPRCVWLLSHHSGALYGVADDHDDASSVVLQDSCCRTLQQLTVRAERGAEGDVDAARNMASAEAGDGWVKEQRCQQVQHLPAIKAKEWGQPFTLIRLHLCFLRIRTRSNGNTWDHNSLKMTWVQQTAGDDIKSV